MHNLAQRVHKITPFYVMELMKQAKSLQDQGNDVIHMSIGEPDFTAIPEVTDALAQAVSEGKTQYTPALGIPELRTAIADHYQSMYGVTISPDQVIITAGASGALQLACAALVDLGTEILLPDPSYPCNRHFITASGGVPKLIQTGPESRFQLTRQDVVDHWGPDVQGVLIASPSNPTGTRIEWDELKHIVDEVRSRDGYAIVDEIYLGLSYDGERRSAAELGDNVVIVNSFSKYFNMTGWRLGWLVVPPKWVHAFERLAQNLVICASTLAQYAALACFTPSAIQTFEARRRAFQERRDFLLPEFERLGLSVPVKPDGAFYIYADVSRFDHDSFSFANRMLNETHICAVPGMDFGSYEHQRYVRFSYANSLERLKQAVQRLEQWL